ncbi:MAG: DNA polymerase III subunit delta [Christensenellales bacterium]|jgi:DNA polymerase-3 subunit delta
MDMDTFVRQLPKTQPGGLYLFAGPETYCMEQALQIIQQKLVPPATEAFDYQPLRGDECSEADLLSALEPLPFMAERRLVVVKDAPWFLPSRRDAGGKAEAPAEESKPAKSGGKDAFRERLDDMLHPGLCLIFTSQEPPPPRSPWVSWVKQKGLVVECKALDAVASLPWIGRMARLEKTSIPRDVALFLWEYTGGGLQRIAAEMHKLAAAAGEGGVITRELVQACTTESPEYKIYRFLEGIMSNRPGEGLEGLWHMLEEGTHPLAALSMIEGQIKAIAFADWIRDSGWKPEEAAAALDVRDFVLRNALYRKRRITPEKARELLLLCRQTDEDIKTGKTGDREAVDVLLRALVSI